MKKTALITGAGKGIGKAISIALAELGYDIIALGRNEQNLNQLGIEIEALRNSKEAFASYRVDLKNRKELQQVLQQIIRDTKYIDVLVNNAGIYFPGDIVNDEEQIRDVLATNLEAVLLIGKEIIPLMKERQSGYIFNIASRAGKIGFPVSGLYVASKFGLVGLNESWYRQLAHDNIKVTAICPAFVDTDMAIEASAPMPAHKMIQTVDIGNTIKFLLALSPETVIKEIVIESKEAIF